MLVVQRVIAAQHDPQVTEDRFAKAGQNPVRRVTDGVELLEAAG